MSLARARNGKPLGTIRELSADWERWIETNILRGVPVNVLVEEMVNKDFDRNYAASAVRHVESHMETQVALSPPLIAASLISCSNFINIDGHIIQVAARFNSPDVVVLDNALTHQECDMLIDLSRPKLKRSTTVDPVSGAEMIIQARSSDGMYFARGENALAERIEKRLAALTGVPVEHGEGLQILRYGVGAQYEPHHDYFAPADIGSAAHLAKGGQRIVTVIMYLNDVPFGGETVFPDLGLAVTPRKGAAVYFSYCDELGHVDARTLHGGAPVTQGDKWIATKWLRQHEYR